MTTTHHSPFPSSAEGAGLDAAPHLDGLAEGGGVDASGRPATMPTRAAPAGRGERRLEVGATVTGAQALVASLEAAGVETVFGLPGGAILPVYDPLLESSIRHVLVRHEQGAGHMAEGYAQATGRAGVAMVTSGPGATNIVTPLADAYLDSIPMVVISGQVPTSVIGTDAFQECDTVGITMPVTKHSWLVTDPAEIPAVVAEAFHLATSGRPGPVLIDLPKDIAQATMRWPGWTAAEAGTAPEYGSAPEPGPDPLPDREQVAEAVALMRDARRPVLYVGGGVLKAQAWTELAALVEATGIPVVTTLMARGVFPDTHSLCLGMPGMHGTYTAITALQRADLLIAVGARFDDRVTGRLDGFAPQARIIHLDVDPAEIGKNRHADVALVGDCRASLAALLHEFSAQSTDAGRDAPDARLAAWHGELRQWQEEHPLVYAQEPDGPLKPQYVIDALAAQSPPGTIVVSGVGQHQMWAAQRWPFTRPRSWINSGGLGTMGFAVPAAIGAKVGCPERTVWAIDGDGCFQMTAQELVTASAERIPIKVAILNNAYLGMVRQWQEMFYAERYSEVYLSPDLPDYVKWAEAMGCVAFRVSRPEDVDPTIQKANAIDDRPVVIDFRTDYREKVYPMVTPGATNDEVVLDPRFPVSRMAPELASGTPRARVRREPTPSLAVVPSATAPGEALRDCVLMD